MPELEIIQTVSGGSHTVILRSDGTVAVASGSGPPRTVPGLSDVAAIAAGHLHCLALKRDGSLWAWGVRRNDGRWPEHPTRIGYMGKNTDLGAPLAAPETTRLDFGNRAPGAEGQLRTLVITNLGLEPLRIWSAEVTGDHRGDFRIAGDNFASVDIYPGSNATVDLAFQPNAGGWRRAEVRLHCNASRQPVAVELVGYGAAADLRLAPDGLRVSHRLGIPIKIEAEGRGLSPRLRYGRGELVAAREGGHRLRQELILELPVSARVTTDYGCNSGTETSDIGFIAVRSVWIELPLEFAVDQEHPAAQANAVETEQGFLVTQRLQVAIPVALCAPVT